MADIDQEMKDPVENQEDIKQDDQVSEENEVQKEEDKVEKSSNHSSEKHEVNYQSLNFNES